MSVITFPSPLDRFTREVQDAAEPFAAICVDAKERLTPEQRFELEARIIGIVAEACSPLTEGLERPGDREMMRTIEALRILEER